MSLHGIDTARLDSYNDEMCFDENLTKTRDKVEVIANENLSNTEALIKIKDDTNVFENKHNLSDKIENEIIKKKIKAKSSSLLSENVSKKLSSILENPKKFTAKDILNLLII